MNFTPITQFSDFCAGLRKAGFSVGGSNSEGIFTLCNYFADSVEWHTGNPETDPWEWRIRALEECGDLAYGRLFFKKGGWITREWYPYFLSARRQGQGFEELYRMGRIAAMERDVYRFVKERGRASMHEIKVSLGETKREQAQTEAAITSLQMKMLITIYGQTCKLSSEGQPYGWPAAVFCTVEHLFDGVFEESCKIIPEHAAERIQTRVLELNPCAQPKAIARFIASHIMI